MQGEGNTCRGDYNVGGGGDKVRGNIMQGGGIILWGEGGYSGGGDIVRGVYKVGKIVRRGRI